MIIEDNLKLAPLVGKATNGSSAQTVEGGKDALTIASAVVKEVKAI